MEKKHLWFNNVWIVRHIRDGKVLWEQEQRNALVDEGEEAILECFFRDLYTPTTFWMRLGYGTVLETDKLINIPGEPVGNGYTPLEVERSAIGFPTKELDEGDWRIVSKVLNFDATTGSVGPVNFAFIATSSDNVGKLLCFQQFSMTRTILAGDRLQLQMRIKVK